MNFTLLKISLFVVSSNIYFFVYHAYLFHFNDLISVMLTKRWLYLLCFDYCYYYYYYYYHYYYCYYYYYYYYYFYQHRGHPRRENRPCLKPCLLFCVPLDNDHPWKCNIIEWNAFTALVSRLSFCSYDYSFTSAVFQAFAKAYLCLLVSALAKIALNSMVIKFLGILKKYVSENKIYFCSRKKNNTSLNKKLNFLFDKIFILDFITQIIYYIIHRCKWNIETMLIFPYA